MHSDRFLTKADIIARQFFIFLLLIVVKVAANAQAKPESSTKVGSVNGSVIITDANGPSYVPGATVRLSGNTNLEAANRQRRQIQTPDGCAGHVLHNSAISISRSRTKNRLS